MTTADRPAFAELMLGMGETYAEPVSAARMEIYFRALVDLDLDAIRSAANVHVRTQKFFPRPAELREALAGSVEDQTELAWAHVLGEVRRVGSWGIPQWPDDATARAALELFGGWQALCAQLPAGGPELIGVAKHFRALHAAYTRREARLALAPSHAEAQQRLQDVTAQLQARGLSTGAL